MMNTAEYTEKLGQLIRGEITVEAWLEYCQILLTEILEMPEVRDAMVRLKYR